MSNPGVITLESFALRSGMSVKIEDNLAESIHVHAGPFRVDLSLDELNSFDVGARGLLDDYLAAFGVSVANFDAEFLGQIGHMLIDMVSASFEKVAVRELLVTVKRGPLGLPKVVNIADSDVIRAMNANYDEYRRTFGLSAERARSRVECAREIVRKGEYGVGGQRIVLFNEQMFIRDGQHRAAAIYAEDPSAVVEVIRLHFAGGQYNVPNMLSVSKLLQLRRHHLRRIAGLCVRYVGHAGRRAKSKFNRLKNMAINGSD